MDLERFVDLARLMEIAKLMAMAKLLEMAKLMEMAWLRKMGGCDPHSEPRYHTECDGVSQGWCVSMMAWLKEMEDS